MNAIVPIPPGASLPAALAPDLTRAAELAREEKAAATRRGPSAGVETFVTITFEEKGGKTVQTFHQRPFLNAERRDSHVGGWTSSFDKLAAYAAQIAKEHSA